MNAWLLTWEGTDRAITTATKLIAIISARRASSFIQEIAEVLYLRNYGTADDMKRLANRKAKRFYGCIKSSTGGFIVGNNPFVYARKVSELQVKKDDTNTFEVVSWKEPPVYQQNPEKNYAIELIEPGECRSLSRSASTTLANDLARSA